MDGLNSKQKEFADNFIELGNQTEAARLAGYKQPHVQGSRLLKNDRVISYIKQRTKPTEEKKIATGDEVLQFLTRVMYGEEKDSFGLDTPIETRLKAATELAKRTCDIKDTNTNAGITIVNNIPKPGTSG